MTEIEKTISIEQPRSDQAAAMDDEAYMMTLVENDDSLLPSNMTFTGLFENECELNADELSDIALLLAPQVSDDDTGGSVSSSGTSATPVNCQDNEEMVATIAATVVASGEIPILPKFKQGAPSAAVVVSPSGSQKRTLTLQEPITPEAPPLKKARAESSTSKIEEHPIELVLQPKPAPSLPELSRSSEVSLGEKSYLPTLAPKPAASAVLKKVTANAASSNTNNTTKTTTTATSKAPAKKTNTAKSTTAITTTTTKVTAPAAAAKAATSEEDRAQQCRDRNRQHARNTRLRKKAYVEELKRQLIDMVEERDAKLLEQAQQNKIVEQQREVRFQVMQDFLQLRGRNEGNPQRWGAILEEGFALTLPKTTFQAMVASANTDDTVQVLDGVPDIMADSTYFASFLQTLGNHTTHTHSTGDDTYIPVTTTFAYLCDRSSFIMDGSNAILNWTARSNGAVQSGARRELDLSGSMRARFCPQTNRLEKAEIQFDTGLVHSQLSI